jgi:hypothetical protein
MVRLGNASFVDRRSVIPTIATSTSAERFTLAANGAPMLPYLARSIIAGAGCWAQWAQKSSGSMGSDGGHRPRSEVDDSMELLETR